MTNPRIMDAAYAYVWTDSSRMLKKSLFSPVQPRRLLHPPALSLPGQPFAQGRASSHAAFSVHRNPQRTPLGKRAVLAALGRAGEERYASGFDSPAALLDSLFEHPAGRVDMVHLVSLVQPNKRDKPNNGLLMLVDFFSILLGI